MNIVTKFIKIQYYLFLPLDGVLNRFFCNKCSLGLIPLTQAVGPSVLKFSPASDNIFMPIPW